MGVYEVMEITKQLRSLIISGASESDMVDQARTDGMILLKQDGLLKVLRGDTSLAELFERLGEH